MKLAVPVLDDGVVALRRPEPGDVDAIYAGCQDPEVPRFTTVPWPYERKHAEGYVRDAAEHWASGVSAPFVLVDSGAGEFLGNMGLVRLDRGDGVAEIGYWVKLEARGRGVATRGARLIARWVLGDLGVHRLELMADVRNHASQRVAEKAGFVREGEVDPPERCRERSDRMVLFALSAEVPAGQ